MHTCPRIFLSRFLRDHIWRNNPNSFRSDNEDVDQLEEYNQKEFTFRIKMLFKGVDVSYDSKIYWVYQFNLFVMMIYRVEINVCLFLFFTQDCFVFMLYQASCVPDTQHQSQRFGGRLVSILGGSGLFCSDPILPDGYRPICSHGSSNSRLNLKISYFPFNLS